MFRGVVRRRATAALAGVLAAATALFIGAAQTADARSVLMSPGGDGTGVLRAYTSDPGGWAPDGSRRVFSGGGGAVLSAPWDDDATGAKFIIANAFGSRYWPSWVGSGWAVAYEYNEGATSSIWANWSSPFCCFAGLSTDLAQNQEFRITPDDGFSYTHPDGAPDGKIVYARGTGGADHDLWVYDPLAFPQHRLVIADGFEPSISPDSSRVAFTRLAGGNRTIWVADLDGGNAHQVSPSPSDEGFWQSTWSPDGLTVAFARSIDGQVFTAPADGSAAAAPVDGLIGTPAYQPNAQNTVARLAGPSRFDTAAKVSQFVWASKGNTGDDRAEAQAVVLSRSDTFADALGGAALAAAKQAPLLLTPPTSLDSVTAAEIDRVLNPGDTVYVLGSPVAISTGVANAITGRGYNVVRLAGPDRYATAVAIANAINPDPDLVLVASGTNFPDALAAGAAAGSYNAPGSGLSAVVLLSQDAFLPDATLNYIENWWTVKVPPFGIGRPAANALAQFYNNTTPLVGTDRYETAILVAHTFFGGENFAGVATGTNWPDALSGGALMATLNGPLLLSPSDSGLKPSTGLYLKKDAGSIWGVMLFGSPVALPSQLDDAVGDAISGPAGWVPYAGQTSLPAALAAAEAPPSSAAVRAAAVGARGSLFKQFTSTAQPKTN